MRKRHLHFDNVHSQLLALWCCQLPCLVLDPRSAFHNNNSQPVSGSLLSTMSPHFNLLDSSRALKPKWRERTHQMVLWRTSGSCFPNIPNWKSWSSSVIVNSLQACGRFPLACCCTSSRFFAKRTPQKILGLARYLLGNFYRLKLISL